MTRDFLKSIEGMPEGAIDKIMAENGRDIEKAKGESAALRHDLEQEKAHGAEITAETERLKAAGASADEYKTKYEELAAKVAVEKEKAEQAKQKADKRAALEARYSAAAVDKDGKPLAWAHDAIKEQYFSKFSVAVEDANNVGKSDADILHALMKDDSGALKGVTPNVQLRGASDLGGGTQYTREQLKAMSPKDINANWDSIKASLSNLK